MKPLTVPRVALFPLFLLLEGCCNLMPAPFGTPVITERQWRRTEKQHFAWRQRECTDSISCYVRNEWRGQEDYIQTYYLTEKDDVLAESWRHVPSGRFFGQAAAGSWLFAVHRKHLNPDTVRSIFIGQTGMSVDSMLLILPEPVDEMFRPMSWHIWAGKTEWYFWVYNGWLMTTEEYKRRKEEYFRLFKSFNRTHPRN